MNLLKQIFKNYIDAFNKGIDIEGRADRYNFWSFIGISIIICPLISYSITIFSDAELPGIIWTSLFFLFFIYKNVIFGLILSLFVILIGINYFREILFFMALAPWFGVPQSLPLPALYIRRLNDADYTFVGLVALLGGCVALYCKMVSVAMLCFGIMLVLTLLPSKMHAKSTAKMFDKNNNAEHKDEETAAPDNSAQ